MEMDKQSVVSYALDAARKAGADGSDITFITSSSTDIQVRLGAVESAERAEDFQLGLRVFCGQQSASVSTGQLDTDNIDALCERVVAMAKAAPKDPFARLARADEQAGELPSIELCDQTELSAEQLTEIAQECEAAARAETGITNSDGSSASAGKTQVLIATSTGFMADYERSSFGFSAVVLAERDGQMERDYDYSSSVFAEDLRAPAEVGRRAAERTLSRLGAKKPETGHYPVIFDTRVSRSLAGHFASAINGAAIARGTSFLKDSLGQKIASETVNIIDDPLKARGAGSRLFDGETLPVSRQYLMKEGVIQSWLLDLSTAAQLDMAPTGHASRSLSGPPHPSVSNLMIADTQMDIGDMISDIKNGFLVTELMGSSVSLTTGDYSRGAAGFWIENGQISWPASEATIASNLSEMFASMQPANDSDHPQSISAPSQFIPQMMVAGA